MKELWHPCDKNLSKIAEEGVRKDSGYFDETLIKDESRPKVDNNNEVRKKLIKANVFFTENVSILRLKIRMTVSRLYHRYWYNKIRVHKKKDWVPKQKQRMRMLTICIILPIT